MINGKIIQLYSFHFLQLVDTVIRPNDIPASGETDMIGEMLGELTGKIVGQRIVSHMGGPIKLERTMETKGKILGQEVTFLATFWSMERHQGGMFSKGHGVLMTKGGEKAVLRGAGISIPGKGPGWSIRGTRYLQTTAPALKRLNNMAILFEVEIAPDGVIRGQVVGVEVILQSFSIRCDLQPNKNNEFFHIYWLDDLFF